MNEEQGVALPIRDLPVNRAGPVQAAHHYVQVCVYEYSPSDTVRVIPNLS